MREEIIVAGSGGQGVLVLGEVIAIANIYQDAKSTWLPSYGPEMRGGTANCSVVIADGTVGSPMIEYPSIVIAFNQPSINKFAPAVASGGIVVANDDAIVEYPELADDVTLIKVSANKVANEVGNARAINMVMFGALLGAKDMFTIDSVKKALTFIWGEEKAQKLMNVNIKAIEAGRAQSS